MPLVRVEVRNEYGLGASELYTNGNKEDPKAVLEGVAVAGLVGILRQLGDLAEFAAEVFHGLQEQVMITSSRSHKLMGRVQRIEAALPPLEKLVLAQRSHLHFAYTSGANWHSHLQREQNHFIYSDLPRFIMDSYEYCRGPPHLNLLDKFDPGGPRSCLKRYSDPSFFRRASSGSDDVYVDKILKKKKSRKIKKKSSLQKTEVSRGTSFSSASGRMQFSSPKMDGQTLHAQATQAFPLYSERKSELGEQSVYSGSRCWSGDSDHLSHPSYSMNHEDQEYKESYSSPTRMHHKEANSYKFIDEKSSVLDDTRHSLSGEETGPTSFCVTWDGKSEILEPATMEYDHDEPMGTFSLNFDFGIEENGVATLTSKEYDHHKNLETLQMTADEEAEDTGAGHFRTSEYDHDYNLEALPTNSNLETQGNGTIHFIVAKVYDLDQTLENVSSNFNLETQDREVTHMETARQTHIDNDDLSMPISGDILLGGSETEAVDIISSQLKIESAQMLSGDLQHDEVESETDNYVDALYTIESEYETDVDGPTKQEVEHSDSDNRAVDNGVDIFSTTLSRTHSSNFEPPNITSSSSDNGAPGLPETCSGERDKAEDISNSLPLESLGSIQSPQMVSDCLDSGSMLDVGSCGNLDNLGSSNVDSVTSGIPSGSTQKNLGVPVSDKMRNSSSDLQNASPQHSSLTSVKLWTNGGLLGLEPSKPPDFSTLNVSSEVSLKDKDDTIGPSTPKSDITEKKSESVEGTTAPDFSTSCQDDRKGGIFMKKASWLFSSADLGANLQKLSDPCTPTSVDISQQNGTSETYGTIQPVRPDILSTRASQDNSSSSSRMFEIGNRLLMNGFRLKPSLDKDDNYTSTSSPNTGVFDLNDSSQKVDNQMLSERSKDMLRSGSPFVSPSSSPPLGHMKISFHPINGYEAQLQLKFSDGTVSRESGRDNFPSFQLVPEPTIPLRDARSDSEDDTFCRSSPYGSDDCLSYQSDSNSEQWESDAPPTGKNHELYDSLHRISFTESVPTSWDTGTVVQGEVHNYYRTQNSLSRDSVEHSQSGHIFDLPSLDALRISVMERNDHELNNLTEPQCPKEPSPSPPPLPPPQWRTMKPQVELEEDRQFAVSENLNYPFDRKFVSTISQQPKPAPLKQEKIIETAQILGSKKPDLHKANWQKEVNQAAFQQEIEEKEDFLHQIRTKSFNLKRTGTAKPTAATVPPTSVQVTAILKKANEIRQVVGSDGEDDNWSDT